MDLYTVLKSEKCYEDLICAGLYQTHFSSNSDDSLNSMFLAYCMNLQDCLGCVNLRHKNYCIFNKQYSKEEYETLIPKIKEQMNKMPYVDEKGRIYKYGEFFPSSISPFKYNETIAQEYFPISQKQAEEKGYLWKEAKTRNYKIDIRAKNLPDNIKDTLDDIVGKTIECLHSENNNHEFSCKTACTEGFRIREEDLSFYRKMNLALPRLCPNCRHYSRLHKRNPMKLWHRSCMKEGCSNEFETSYAPDRPEIIYCESCYQKEVY